MAPVPAGGANLVSAWNDIDRCSVVRAVIRTVEIRPEGDMIVWYCEGRSSPRLSSEINSSRVRPLRGHGRTGLPMNSVGANRVAVQGCGASYGYVYSTVMQASSRCMKYVVRSVLPCKLMRHPSLYRDIARNITCLTYACSAEIPLTAGGGDHGYFMGGNAPKLRSTTLSMSLRKKSSITSSASVAFTAISHRFGVECTLLMGSLDCVCLLNESRQGSRQKRQEQESDRITLCGDNR